MVQRRPTRPFSGGQVLDQFIEDDCIDGGVKQFAPPIIAAFPQLVFSGAVLRSVEHINVVAAS